MPPAHDPTRDLDPITGPQRYVQENRDDLIKLIIHSDPFIRTLGLAILYKDGQRADIDSVIRELEILKDLDEDELPHRFTV